MAMLKQQKSFSNEYIGNSSTEIQIHWAAVRLPALPIPQWRLHHSTHFTITNPNIWKRVKAEDEEL